MPDIAMCKQEDCPRKMECYRYLAVPEHWQSYILPNPKDCKHFWQIEAGMRLSHGLNKGIRE